MEEGFGGGKQNIYMKKGSEKAEVKLSSRLCVNAGNNEAMNGEKIHEKEKGENETT